MEPDKKADDLLREKLNSYSSPVPAGLFDAMDKKRKEEQTASVFGWRVKAGVSAMILLLGLGCAYWQMTSDSVSKTETVIASSEIQRTVKESKENNQTQVVAQVQTELTEQQDLTSVVNNTKQEKIFTGKIQEQQQTKLSNSSASFPTNVVKSTLNQSDVIKQNTPVDIPTENNEIFFNSEKSNDILKEKAVIPSDNILAKVEEVAKEERVRQSILVNPLANKGLLIDAKHYAVMPKVECGWEARKVYLYFDAITSLDMAFRTLSPKLEDNEAYAISRNQTEGVQGSTSLGFRASAVTKGGFAMRTGLIYSTIKEPFSQIIHREYTRTIVTENEEGEIIATDIETYTIPEEYEFTNRHKLLDVPVILGYEIDKEKYNIGFNGGAYFNITASQEGRFLNPNNEIVDFSTNSPIRYDAFKTNVGVSLYSSFAVNYKITPSIHFIFEPYGRYYLNSFTTENYELNQNYFVAGMQIGLRMKM